ncbi:pyridoxal-phosphate dependent enzyme [Mucilaginibacter phyllosphaerae]|uniref:D-cysteine desulfhydrase n=1 Tax=Mucilaginibacter phyllosphaerae TaxID=1812349 RepID=A0A4Y8AFU0_9SPHI|nr:pyridoxal-phosphate dependent enzyme [Mucilaginibacter phyllosphaerae]MBB3968718.1 D-cysteine desulfhydrase [Mucilaginibacter phyllosphaerae]TEW67646.1 pyridoxal-phosphate dependent enzyme [Mucilaginibacter phyllosphaerae]GGH14307.1 1-aminocyclopropane-1-carboxylate deaminase [Mucilaginibacter phyllosphaerae]
METQTLTGKRALFKHMPGLSSIVQPLDILQLPSPVKEEKELAALWSLQSLHVKRDDLVCDIYGGSKARMLEYFFARAQAQKKDAVASMGPYVSHQFLGISAFAKALGYRSLGVLAPQPAHQEIDHYKEMYEQAGASTIRCKHYINIPSAYLKTRLNGFPGKLPYWIPAGGNSAYGVIALVDAAFEFVRQVKEGILPMPQDIVVPTGTCATAAGLYLGFSILKFPVRLVAVRMVPMTWTSAAKLKTTAKKGLALLRKAGFKDEVQWGELLWLNDYAGPGYGEINPLASAAMGDVQQHGSFRTEITYTGKTLAVFKNPLLHSRRVVFWNTYSAINPGEKLEAGYGL